LKVLTWLSALSLAVAVLLCKWIVFPLSNQVRGFRFSPLGYSAPHAFVLSYGVLAAILIMLWAVAFQVRGARALCLVGIGLLALAITTLMQVAFYDPILLKRLASEADQAQLVAYFTAEYLPPNPWIEPARWRFLTFDSLVGRALSGWYFLGFGWYATIAAGVACLSSGLTYVEARQRRWMLLIGGAAFGGLIAILASSHIRAQIAIDRGAFAVSTGSLQTAVGSYREAMRLDGWNRLNPNIYSRIGEIDSASGRTNTLEYQIYRAELLAAQNNYPGAIAEYHQLSESNRGNFDWIRLRESALWTNYGQGLLSTGASGAAATAFASALALNPSNWLAGFCLSRSYFLSGSYQQTIDLATRLLEQISDPQLRAGLYCDVGDAQMRLGNLAEAHLAYRRAWTVDEKLARRTLTSLVGP